MSQKSEMSKKHFKKIIIFYDDIKNSNDEINKKEPFYVES